MRSYSYVMRALSIIAPAVITAEVSFLVMGDWGGIPIYPWHTPAEGHTAKAMGEETTKINSSFALALGDNFYESGVKDEHDKRFKRTFEDVFTATSLQGADHFKVCAGNHDHRGNVTGQIAYSAHSPRWFFPSLYYDWTVQVDASTTAQIILLDTVTLSGQSSAPDGTPLQGDEYSGPADPLAASAQLQWLNKTLSASTADYIVVGGHFPVWSVGLRAWPHDQPGYGPQAPAGAAPGERGATCGLPGARLYVYFTLELHH